jgi:hypothetical protein
MEIKFEVLADLIESKHKELNSNSQMKINKKFVALIT